MRSVIPFRPFTVRIILRGVGTWVALHGLFAFTGSGPGVDSAVLLSWRAAGLLVFLGSALTLFDTARRNELLFLGNCGIRGWSVTLLCALPAVVLEVLLHLGFATWNTF